jgi:histidyl-tRNA synthetase
MALLTGAPRGTKDVLPSQSYKWQYVESVLRRAARDFGFSEIRIPTIEHTELFLRGVGDTTDVVQKEMYTFLDKGGRSITLRPEITASVMRSFLENTLYASGLPVKVWCMAPNFRYEKPQAGRLREHHQFDVEVLGAAGPETDAEVIGIADTYIKRLGIKGVKLFINSIGCPDCRPGYHAALKEYFESRKDKLCPTCHERLERNPLRVLDCKDPGCAEVAKDAPHTVDYLCPECQAHFEGLKRNLTDMGIAYAVDTRIVRGLDYYTRTVFEFVTDCIGAQGTVCGGGRYDGLAEALGGQPMPGIGFGSGMERLLLVMEASGAFFPENPGCDLFVAYIGDEASRFSLKLTHELRLLGVSAERDTTGRSLKAQMKYADRIGAKRCVVIGGEELSSGVSPIKNMATGETAPCRVSAVARLEDCTVSTTSARGMPDGWRAIVDRAWSNRGLGDFWQHCLVAEGALDVACDRELKLWDFAAVQLIVEEAGGRCTTFAGLPPAAGASFVATNGVLHDEVVSLLGV